VRPCLKKKANKKTWKINKAMFLNSEGGLLKCIIGKLVMAVHACNPRLRWKDHLIQAFKTAWITQ
jgi:hypothetical protein